MSRILVILTVLFSSVCFAVWNPVTVAEELVANNGTLKSGYLAETGVWVVAIGQDKDQNRAAMEAQRALAGFLMTQVESGSQSSSVEANDEVATFFSQQTKTSVNRLLKGVRIEQNSKRDGVYLAIAVLTQYTIDQSATLDAMLAEDTPDTVVATGHGATRDEAIQAATRAAIGQVCGVSLATVDSATDDFFRSRTYAHVQGVVKTYRILQESIENNQWRVKIIAEVNKDELLQNYSAQLKTIGDPLFYIVSDNDDALHQLSDWFTHKGIKTTNHSGTADYQIKITTEFAQRVHPIKRRSGIQLQLTTTCFDKAGVQLFSIQNDPREATAFVGSPDRQCQIAIEKAINQISDPLHLRLQQGVLDAVNNGRSVRLLFRNCTLVSQMKLVEEIAGRINDMPGAGAAASYYDAENRTVTIRCSLKGNAQDFVGALKQEFTNLPVLLAAEANKIIFTF